MRVSNRLAIAGLGVLSLSLIGAILLISDILFKSPAPLIFTAATAHLRDPLGHHAARQADSPERERAR